MKSNMCGCEFAMHALFSSIQNVKEERLNKYVSKKMEEEAKAKGARY